MTIARTERAMQDAEAEALKIAKENVSHLMAIMAMHGLLETTDVVDTNNTVRRADLCQ